MHRSIRFFLVLLNVLSLSAAVAAQAPTTAPTPSDAHVRAAERLLEVTHAEQLNAVMIEQLQQSQLEQTPQLAPYADLMREFFAEQLSWDKLRPESIQLYTEMFTVAELEELIGFYESPLGRKLLAKTPEIMMRAMAMTQQRLQAAMPAFLQRMYERASQSPASPAERPAGSTSPAPPSSDRPGA